MSLPPYPIHYQNRLREIELALNQLPPDLPPSLVLLGDSISESYTTAQLRGKPVINMGISGDQADHPECGMLRRVPLISRTGAVEVAVLVGINDLNCGKPSAELVRQQKEVLLALGASVPNARLLVHSVIPTCGEYQHLLPLVLETNELLHQTVEELGHDYVDLAAALAGTDGELRQEFTEDGVHLNARGYAVWTDVLERYDP